MIFRAFVLAFAVWTLLLGNPTWALAIGLTWLHLATRRRRRRLAYARAYGVYAVQRELQ